MSRVASLRPADAPDPGRVEAIDALRGVALLGILLMNVRAMALPGDAYAYPLAGTRADLWAYASTVTVGQGKFLATFAALFGVSLVLASRRDGSWGRFGRRQGVLAAFGLAHITLIWYGDILLLYSILGLIAFALRTLASRTLWTLAVVGHVVTLGLLALLALVIVVVPMLDVSDMPESLALLGPEAQEAERQAYLGGYGDQLRSRLATATVYFPYLLIVFGPGTLGLMLAGIALLRTGFFSGDWSRRAYVTAAVAGLTIGMGGSGLAVALAWRAGWPEEAWASWGQLAVVAVAPAGALGIASVVIPNARRLGVMAAVGRMAFTNYIFQSALGTFVFYGGWGLGYFGMGYAGQLGVVAAIWAVQVPLSVGWMRFFRYGPLEWLWRGLSTGTFPALRSPHERATTAPGRGAAD